MLTKHFLENTAGRDFVVGDLHGCYDKLMRLLRRVDFDKSRDRLFSVGDLIDRGPSSVLCLGLLAEPWFHAVQGNHEDILLQIVEQGGDWQWWMDNGGNWANDVDIAELKFYAERIRQLPYAITVGAGEHRFNVIHAEFFGSDADLDSGDFEPHIAQRMLWGRALFNGQVDYCDIHQGLSLTYCGHSILHSPERMMMQYFIDTGAFLNMEYWGQKGCLTLVEHKTGQIWQA